MVMRYKARLIVGITKTNEPVQEPARNLPDFMPPGTLVCTQCRSVNIESNYDVANRHYYIRCLTCLYSEQITPEALEARQEQVAFGWRPNSGDAPIRNVSPRDLVVARVNSENRCDVCGAIPRVVVPNNLQYPSILRCDRDRMNWRLLPDADRHFSVVHKISRTVIANHVFWPIAAEEYERAVQTDNNFIIEVSKQSVMPTCFRCNSNAHVSPSILTPNQFHCETCSRSFPARRT